MAFLRSRKFSAWFDSDQQHEVASSPRNKDASKCDTFQTREFRFMAVNAIPPFAMLAYDPGTANAESTLPSTTVTPAISEYSEEQVNAAFAHVTDIISQNLHNAERFQRSFQDYKRYGHSLFLLKMTVDPNGNRNEKLFRAYKLRQLFWASAELYFPWNDGGIFRPGLYERALEVLAKKPGAFDAFRERFGIAAQSRSPESRAVKLASCTSERSFVGEIFVNIASIAGIAVTADVLLDLEIPFGAGGTVLTLTEGGEAMLRDSGIAGKGDLGIFSGITGKLEIGLEAKFQLGVSMFSNEHMRNLFLEAVAFMIGRDLDFMIAAAPEGMMLFWREDLQEPDPATGVRRSEFFMFPDREYLRFEDPENSRKLATILGECARVSATSPFAQVKRVMHPTAFRIPDGEKAHPTCIPVTVNAPGAPGQSATPGETSRLAVSNRGDVLFKSYDLGYHLTEDQFKRLLEDEDSSCCSSIADEEDTFPELAAHVASKLQALTVDETVSQRIDL